MKAFILLLFAVFCQSASADSYSLLSRFNQALPLDPTAEPLHGFEERGALLQTLVQSLQGRSLSYCQSQLGPWHWSMDQILRDQPESISLYTFKDSAKVRARYFLIESEGVDRLDVIDFVFYRGGLDLKVTRVEIAEYHLERQADQSYLMTLGSDLQECRQR